MNLLGIRTELVEKTGRFDLVVDRTNYADNGANFYIQAGQRLLETLFPFRKDIGRYVCAVILNQSSVFLRYVRAILDVEIKGSGENRGYLDRKGFSWLRSEYGSDYGEKARGTATFSGQPTAGETITIGAESWTFAASRSVAYEISIGSSVSETVGNLRTAINTDSPGALPSVTAGRKTAEQLSSTELLVTYEVVGTAGNSVVFTTTSGNISLDGSSVLGGTLQGRNNDISTGTPIYFSSIVSTPHPELTLDRLSNLTEDTHDILFGWRRFQRNGLLFMPPADETYTMTIHGHFFEPLESDYDVTYYTDVYPEVSIMASMLAMEVFMRNTQGVKDMINSINLWQRGIDYDLVRAEMSLAGNTLRG